ncbi:hypothetical protein JCM19237_296 [Photobacterium aphoticum]|uniref:Uncharacterized protein n=1 Tax=Photobacterium aphoticum TaxID=754436 RepID=A0A090QYH0_9GAMM|nr:hypothetical protein JCM19237_296 [Photobacterium aphoticum]
MSAINPDGNPLVNVEVSVPYKEIQSVSMTFPTKTYQGAIKFVENAGEAEFIRAKEKLDTVSDDVRKIREQLANGQKAKQDKFAALLKGKKYK